MHGLVHSLCPASTQHQLCVCVSAAAAASAVAGKLKEFKAYLEGEGAGRQDIKQLKDEVEALANAFPMPGL